MNQMIDPRLLRAFLAVADDASFTNAAVRLNMTQSTISQQVSRLEDQTGQTLIDRDARPIRMTASGERLAGYARRILALQEEASLALRDPSGTVPLRIGLAEDILTVDMARLFAKFAADNRQMRLDVTAGLSRTLSGQYRDGHFDIIVIKEETPEPDCRTSFAEPIGWFEAEHGMSWPSPLPFVTFPTGGLYRDQMFRRAEAEGRRWYVAFAGTSLHNVITAVEAGFGISLLPCRAVAGKNFHRSTVFGPEPDMVTSLYAWEDSSPIAPLVAAMQDVLKTR